MATAMVTIDPTSTADLVAAQSGAIIRLKRLVATPGSQLTIKSNTTAILPKLGTGSSSHMDVTFTAGTVATAAGEALTATTSGTSGATVWVVYDIV